MSENMIEEVYNTHLILNRVRKGQPFRIKKNFDKIEQHKDYQHYKTLANFFESKPEIQVQLFFDATAYFLKDVDYIPIKEFATSKALTNYVEYLKVLETLDLDTQENLKWGLDSFKFINKFLKGNNISPSEYLDFKSTAGGEDFWVHIKRGEITKYVLFQFPDFRKKLNELYRDPELWEFYLGKYDFNPTFLWKRWDRCVKFKLLARKLYQKLI